MNADRQRKPKLGLISWKGFTLAELLISLAILGVIATFTIPKILSTQQNAANSSKAKELAAAVAAAFQNYQATGGNANSFQINLITPSLNYISTDSTSLVDDVNGGGSRSCGTATLICYLLHSGGVLYFWTQDGFCNGTTTGIHFTFDPQPGFSGSTSGNGKAIRFVLYKNGRIATQGTRVANTQYNDANNPGGSCTLTMSGGVPSDDPSWFSWN